MPNQSFSIPDTLEKTPFTGSGGVGGGSGFGVEDILSGLGSVFSGLGTGGWGALIGGLTTGIAGMQNSPQEEQYQQIFDKLEDSEEYLKSTPFSKEEIMGTLLPEVQRIYRGSADVMAGKAGAAVGEAGVPKGQAFGEYYTQALGDIIARGEEKAGDVVGKFGQWFSGMDAQAKNRFLDAIRLQIQATAGTESMTDLQSFVSGMFPGAAFGGKMGGQMDIIGELMNQMEGRGDLTAAASGITRPKGG